MEVSQTTACAGMGRFASSVGWRLALLALLSGCIGETNPRAAPGDGLSVVTQPMGSVTDDQLEAVRRAIEELYGARATVVTPIPIPDEAYYPPRQRYRAERLLDVLGMMHPEADKVLGITAKDISTTKGEHEDWGIFGLARMPGRAAVVSTFRLRARGASETTALQRLATVAQHEVGHTLGLRHCPERGCILEDAKGSVATVDRASGLCDACASAVAAR